MYVLQDLMTFSCGSTANENAFKAVFIRYMDKQRDGRPATQYAGILGCIRVSFGFPFPFSAVCCLLFSVFCFSDSGIPSSPVQTECVLVPDCTLAERLPC